MEAAHIAWRPLGQLLVEQGMLTGAELELALAKQQQTGRRLGETIVECGFVSGPQLASALAAQYGIELTTETGFGTGLRSEIQRRHEHDRRGSVALAVVPAPAEAELEAPGPAQAPAEPRILPRLEEQWARLAAAEAALAERERELREQREINDRLRARLAEQRHEPDAARPDGHLLFVHLGGRYALVPREGPPPLARAELLLPELDEGAFVVAGSRPSPLPGDGRPCIVAVRADLA